MRYPVTTSFIALMLIGYPISHALPASLGYDLFVLSTAHPFYLWTYFTSVLAHESLTHLGINLIAVATIFPFVERRTPHFPRLLAQTTFLVNATILGVAFLGGFPYAVWGASALAAAMLSVLMVYYATHVSTLFIVAPVALLVYSSVGIVMQGVIYTGIARIAHVVGVMVGIGVGYIIDFHEVYMVSINR